MHASDAFPFHMPEFDLNNTIKQGMQALKILRLGSYPASVILSLFEILRGF